MAVWVLMVQTGMNYLIQTSHVPLLEVVLVWVAGLKKEATMMIDSRISAWGWVVSQWLGMSFSTSRLCFSYLLCSREERPDVCQLIVKQGDGVLLIGSPISRWSLVCSKLSLFCNEGMFETRLFLWFDGQGEVNLTTGIHNPDSRRSGVSNETTNCSCFG